MKTTVIIAVLLLTVMFSSPLRFLKDAKTTENGKNAILQTAASSNNIPEQTLGYDSFRVLIDDKVQTLSAKEYILGVIAAEMPLAFNEEALKAQAVAAYTFACYRKNEGRYSDYDISCDSETDQAYVSLENAMLKWGDSANEYKAKLENIYSQVEKTVLTYNDKPALSVYHAISPGVTVDCQDVWGNKVPYLVSVDSIGDTLCEDYISTATFSPQELTGLLGATGDTPKESWFENIDTSSSGKVIKLRFCQKELSGSDVAKALGLRSSAFSVTYESENFVFTVKGYGHGVGMSQRGAEYMAKSGATYQEILYHYYPGCILKNEK